MCDADRPGPGLPCCATAGSVPNADRVTESVSGARPVRSLVWRRRSGSVTVALLHIGRSCAKCPDHEQGTTDWLAAERG
jgi:hypothetical protein